MWNIICFIRSNEIIMTKRIFIFTIFTILISCSEKHVSFENYATYPVKFAKKNFVYPNNEFEIFLPSNWESKIENYEDNDEIILGIDAVSKPNNENFINAMSIQKMKPFSLNNSLKSEYDNILEKIQQGTSLKIIDSGKTDFLTNEAYFIHSKSNTGTYGELEMITIIIKSKNDDNYYHLNASAPTVKELKTNMSIMINCFKTFKQNN
jgi:hypothetical protein